MAALPRRLHRSSTALTPVAADPDRELLAFNVRLAKQRQGLLDVQRLERKAFREHARVDNAVAAYTRELATLLRQRGFSRHRPRPLTHHTGETVLVVQLSDLHFNERVELPSNRYDFSVASARLAKLAARIKQLAACFNAQKLVVACLGDFLNSDRRLDELLSNATNRSRATLPVEVYGITGNESRVTAELGWSDPLATDSYDLMIYAILERSLASVEGIGFCGFRAHELLFEVLGHTFLCLHGHQVGANLQKSVQEIAGKYAAQGITVDYTLFGHLHATAIGDYHARNASLVGSNAYSEAGLNFCSKAAQNLHIVSTRGIDSLKVDLQEAAGSSRIRSPANGRPTAPAVSRSCGRGPWCFRWWSDAMVTTTSLAAAMAPEAATAAEPMALPEEWADWSVVELRAMLRSLPIDRRELPAPIEKLRRQELLDALQQLQC